MLFDQNMIIDATTKGSIARFVNHSCNPNCRMEKWTVNGQPRMALFAGERGIMTGEELTYDYNFDPFSQKNVQECRCGEPGCRGVLGPRPKKEDRRSEELEDEPKKEKGLKRKMADVLDEVVGKVTKKQKTETRVQIKARSRTRVYSNISPKKTATGAVATKAKAVAKAVRGSTASPIKATSGLARNPSMLKKMVKGAKDKATEAKASAAAGIKRSRSGKRIVSSTSATEALLEKEITTQQKTTKKTQMKSKVGSVKSSMVRTVRGRQSGQSRSMRIVGDDE
jgi:[histone H3]-lysine4 N-trimethyltransferase ASH1L